MIPDMEEGSTVRFHVVLNWTEELERLITTTTRLPIEEPYFRRKRGSAIYRPWNCDDLLILVELHLVEGARREHSFQTGVERGR